MSTASGSTGRGPRLPWIAAVLCLLLLAAVYKRLAPAPKPPAPTVTSGYAPDNGTPTAPPGGAPAADSAEDDDAVGKRCAGIRDAQGTRIDRFLFEEDSRGGARWTRVQELPDFAPQLASLFLIGGKLFAADMVRNSPSGDWFQQLAYCYRDDGSLLSLTATLNTFHGQKKVVDKLRFDRSGARTSSEREVFDLQSGKPVQAEPGSFMEIEPRIYLKASDLAREVGW